MYKSAKPLLGAYTRCTKLETENRKEMIWKRGKFGGGSEKQWELE